MTTGRINQIAVVAPPGGGRRRCGQRRAVPRSHWSSTLRCAASPAQGQARRQSVNPHSRHPARPRRAGAQRLDAPVGGPATQLLPLRRRPGRGGLPLLCFRSRQRPAVHRTHPSTPGVEPQAPERQLQCAAKPKRPVSWRSASAGGAPVLGVLGGGAAERTPIQHDTACAF